MTSEGALVASLPGLLNVTPWVLEQSISIVKIIVWCIFSAQYVNYRTRNKFQILGQLQMKSYLVGTNNALYYPPFAPPARRHTLWEETKWEQSKTLPSKEFHVSSTG